MAQPRDGFKQQIPMFGLKLGATRIGGWPAPQEGDFYAQKGGFRGITPLSPAPARIRRARITTPSAQQPGKNLPCRGLGLGQLHLGQGKAGRLGGTGQKRFQTRRGGFDVRSFVQRDAQHLGQGML